jgi:hypothetical protein
MGSTLMRTRRSEAGAQAEADLKFWGFHVGKQYAADGYPTAASGYADLSLKALLSGHSDLNPRAARFGLNIRDMPGDAWLINARVMQLRRELREVLLARYALPMDYETGQPYRAEMLADELGLKVHTYFRRLRDARDKFARLYLAEKNVITVIPVLTDIAR